MPNQVFLVDQCWKSHPCNVQYAREAIRSFVHYYASSYADLIELAIGEACANAIEHGSPSGEQSEFRIRCILEADPKPGRLVFEVEDEGKNFAFSTLPDEHTPDLDSEGGRGLFIIKQIMDEVGLHSTARGLVIRMTKHCDSDAA